MATPFSVFGGSNTSTLTDALLAPNSGIVIPSNSILLKASSQDAVNFYDGSLTPLGISSGLLLTSGTTPGTTNTVGWFGNDNSGTSGFYNGDADIDAVVNTVFQTQSYDATTLSFDFNVTDSTATSISFDLVFGSDEYPEWVDAFVDSAIVMVNGVNYALFNHDPNHPLSVISANLTAGYFQDNANNVLPIEYDGVSHVLKIIAPINSGTTNHIKIGIADTGDHIYDSGIFISNLSAGNIPGSGVVSTPPNSGTDNSDVITGSAQDEFIDLKGGNDIAYAGAGDDIVVAGAGDDSVYGGSGNDQIKGDGGNDILDGGDGISDTVIYGGNTNEYNVTFNLDGSYTITDNKTDATSEGKDTLSNIELAKFSNGLFALTSTGLSSVGNPPPPPTNTPGLVLISGVSSAGNVLTATVSDPDGISSGISYQWQTSSDNGATWTNVGSDSKTYTVTSADIGTQVQVTANYIDNGAISESPVSLPKTILETKTGDLVVTLLNLKAPLGSSTINPLTTLVQDAIDLGLSPNTAAIAIKNVLGLPSDIQLQSYDAYAVLQSNSTNANALAVEKVAVQVAILTSLSDDDTGLNLTSAIINAATNNQTLNLANANDLANILGLDITGLTTANYPQPLREIFDRNKSMSDAIADGGDVSVIEKEWQDLLSINDGINSTSIADLSIHINQAPIGTAIATLPEGTEGSAYILNTNDLLAGFSDPEGGILSVTSLSANISGTFIDNQDGTWTFTPNTTNYNGPVELTYSVTDNQGANISANQLFVIAPNTVTPINSDPIGSATAVLADGSEDITYTINASDLLQGFSDADGDTLSVDALTVDNGNLVDNLDGTWTLNPNLNYNGLVNLSYNVIDGNGGIVPGSQSFNLVAVNDAPTVFQAITNQTANVGNKYSFTFDANTFNDVDAGDSLTYKATLGNGSALPSWLTFNATTRTFSGTPTINSVGTLNVQVTAQDNSNSNVSTIFNLTVSNSINGTTGNDKLTGTNNNDEINGLAGNDTLNGRAGNDILNGGTGNDSLVGGIGADTLIGGDGNDIYSVDNLADIVTEENNNLTVGGIDLVNANINYTLSANLENLNLIGSSLTNGTGNSLNNQIVGNGRGNVINGSEGNDTLIGNAGNDTLIGGIGDDILNGGAGNDSLTGGSGMDIFRFNSTSEKTDRISDFVQADDTIAVSSAFGGGLVAGTLKIEQFTIGNIATNSTQRFIYNSTSGALFFDIDGNGATKAVQFATLSPNLAIDYQDFLVI
ncbi:alkaline phosphatase [Geminocystis sp. NIES-3708]|uniref:cadherin-like domain-containing protein n=1 Tax=Geminocystis sp. NIES-3708 TaxID=1615909 RepID=UPI0005FC66BA|nr:cadherin-like domain-containing protein [Geminocystis sp. NIES-3708]BAQ61232.1 alkaline phosphatase [Geminocystis sp. NIES-3708]